MPWSYIELLIMVYKQNLIINNIAKSSYCRTVTVNSASSTEKSEGCHIGTYSLAFSTQSRPALSHCRATCLAGASYDFQ